IDEAKGTFYDHENKVGGGTLDLIVHCGEASNHVEAKAWLKQEGLIQAYRHTNGDGAHCKDTASGPQSRIAAIYPYRDADGKLLYEKVRLEPKFFYQRRPDPTAPGGYRKNLDGVTPVPYRLPELIDEREMPFDIPTVLIVEGEKDAENAAEFGFAATTTNSGGANNWHEKLNPYFEGFDVILIPDNDTPGR